MEEGPNPTNGAEEGPDPAFRMKLSEFINRAKKADDTIPVTVDQLKMIAHELIVSANVIEEVIKQDLSLPIFIKAVSEMKFHVEGMSGACSILFLHAIFNQRLAEVDPLGPEPADPSRN